MDIQHAAAVAEAGDRSSSSTCSQFSQPPLSSTNLQKNTVNSNTAVTASFITSLCDDTLLRILSYADLRSLVYLTQCTSSSLRHRFNHSSSTTTATTNDGLLDTVEKNSWNNRCPDIWQEVFVNHNFAPVDSNNATNNNNYNALCLRQHEEGGDSRGIQPIDYYNAIRERLSLWSNLNGNSALQNRRRKRAANAPGNKKSPTKQCFSLPNRFFHFVPILPPDMMQYPPALPADTNVNNDMSFSFVEDDEENIGTEMMHNSFEILEDNNINQHEPDGHHPIDNELDDTQGHHVHLLDDPPPVEFACDSFCLTSPSTGAEYVLLNPFSGSVEVYDNVLDNAISSDESLMELALLDASESITQKRSCYNTEQQHGEREENDHYPDMDESSEVIAGEAIHHRFQNHSMYDTPPKQVLFSVNDYFDLDLNEYFGEHTPFATISNRRGRTGNVTVDWVGVDSHIALQKNDYSSIAGNIIGAARILTMESLDRVEEELECTEIFAWSNFERESDAKPSSSYDIKYVCRAAGSFYFLDIDANYGKLYAAFQAGCCPFVDCDTNAANWRRDDQLSNHMQMEEESVVNDPIRLQKAIYCLPLLRYDETPCTPEAISSYFPAPDACILAQYPVSSFSLDPTGTILLVGTNCGTVEIWHTGVDPHMSSTAPQRLQILSVHESFMKRHRSITMDGRHSSKNEVDAIANDLFDNKPPNNIEFVNNATETQDDLALLENVEDEFPHKHPTSKVSQIYLSRHLPLHQVSCFITKQRNPELGTTLLLWQTSSISSETTIQDSINMQYHITAMINLPLSAQCHPEVHFDGRRVIVYGKDHIGQILLVYHVLSTRHDQDEFDEADVIKSPKKKSSSKTNNGEESGGVINISEERRIKFVNRIRHVGLGGIQYYDPMLLSANERFLMCNTKAGNLVGSDGTRNASEGLLVIDLQEYGP